MASEEDQPIYNDDDFDDDDDDSEPLTATTPADIAVDSQSSSSAADEEEEEDDDNSSSLPSLTPTTTAGAVVTVAIPSSAVAPPPISSVSSAVTVALPDPKRHSLNPNLPEKKPIDDSRRLFQRLWTDEDEIELLQGFLDYTTSRGTSGHQHHHDTAAFYDQIKSKLQLEFNKNQLVEKLRRLKKKYRNVLSKMSTGKEFVFKSPHDQATFELSSKIWSNLSANFRAVADIDDDDQNPNPNINVMASATPPRPPNSSYVISHINLNSAAAAVGTPPMVVDHNKAGSVTNAGNYISNMNMNSASNAVGFDVMMSNLNSPAAKLSTRKRPRTGVVKIEDKFVRNVGVEGGNLNDNSNVINNNNNMNNVSINNNNNNVGCSSSNINLGSTMQGLIEEAVRSCLSPMVKDLVNNAVSGAVFGGGGGGGSGFKGVGALALNAVPLNFSGVNVVGSSGGDVMDEKWRKQHILELEVYSKRLELVQDQIKLSLEELRSMGS